MTEHDRIEKIAEARKFFIATPVILPILKKRHDQALSRLMNQYYSGETNFLNTVAELYTINNLIRELETQGKIYEAEEAKHANRRS